MEIKNLFSFNRKPALHKSGNKKIQNYDTISFLLCDEALRVPGPSLLHVGSAPLGLLSLYPTSLRSAQTRRMNAGFCTQRPSGPSFRSVDA